MNRRVARSFLVAAPAAVLLASAALLHNLFPLIQAHWYCHRIATAKTAAQARECILQLFAMPHRKAKLRVACNSLGTGNDQLDYAIIQFVGWPDYRPPHPVPEQSLGRENLFMEELEDFLEVVLEVIRQRPEVAELFLHHMRFAVYEVGVSEWNILPYVRDFMFEQYPDPDFPDPESPNSKALMLAVACRLTGRDDLIPAITNENWEYLAAKWKGWLDSNSGFMTYNSTTGHMTPNLRAKGESRPVPESEAWMPSSATPLPGWSEPVGWGHLDIWYEDCFR